MKILDLGCGNKKIKGAVGIDVNSLSDADIIHDLNTYPYPLNDNEFDYIICSHVIEHLDNVVKTMEELYRISQKNAIIEITGPFAGSQSLFTDPTHKRAFTSRSFDYFVPETDLYKIGFSYAKFEILSVEYEKDTTRFRWWDRLLLNFANIHKSIYESRFMFIYPVQTIYFQLKVKK